MMAAFLAGVSLGFGAGISPGPLLTLVITTTLARGLAAGMRVGLSPLLTDAPIILIAVLAVDALPEWAAAALGALGGCYVVYLGVETVRSARGATLNAAGAPGAAASELGRGVLVNLLSPHPWLFWITVGAPILTAQWQRNPWQAAAFLLGFYALLVGSKLALALAVAGGRRRLDGPWYGRVLAASGAVLVVFGAILLWQAAQGVMQG
jgi:threonine/homoserine/homoserine lactone efflux protein